MQICIWKSLRRARCQRIHRQRIHRQCTATVLAVVLSTVAAWGLGLTGLAQAGIVPGAVREYDASQDADGDQIWEDIGTLANRDWTLSGPTGPNPSGPARTAVSSATTITHAYNFDGVDDSAINSPDRRFSNFDTTFELLFRPDLFPTGDVRPIFEFGNGPRGVSFGLMEDTLVFVYRAGGDGSGELTFNLSSIGITDFIQVAGVIDDTNDEIRLYVNGGNEQVLGVGSGSDFMSNDSWGLANNANRGGGGQNASAFNWGGFYDGDIALLREYRTAFSLAEVQQNFAALPEPSTATLACFLFAVFYLCPSRKSI